MPPSPLRAVGSYPPSGLEALTGWKPACKPYGLEAEPEAPPSPSRGEGKGEGENIIWTEIK
ncbi:MAG: hypothetical protein NT009_12870 [Proteobacteria bacterium]|nr:hypothetical protein [Pseudomonadota bacterium]